MMRKRVPIGLMGLLIGCTVLGMVLLSGLSVAQDFATPIPSPTWTPVNTAVPIPVVGCVAPLGLVPGSIAYVAGGVMIRAEPTLSSPYMGFTEQASIFTVVSGPVCADNYNWWQVTGPAKGWVAEGRPDTGYFVSDSGTTVFGDRLDCGTPKDWVVGEKITLFYSLRIREAPGVNSLVLTVAPENSEAIVLGEPVCADAYNWWPVRIQVLDIIYDGYIAEGTRASTMTWSFSDAELNQEICGVPLELAIGDNGYINYYDRTPKRLRSLPSLDAPILVELIDNVPVTIIDGPFCKDGYNWWKIQVRSNIPAVGWVAEGGRWIRKIEAPRPGE